MIIIQFYIAKVAFTHAGLTTRYRTKTLHKIIFVLPRMVYKEDRKLA